MAKNRYINTRFWNDGFISTLMPYEKLLFLYFLTNEHTNICGVYELPLKIIVSETGIAGKKVMEIISSFCGKIVYVNGWVGIKNFSKYQNTDNSNVQKGIKEALRGIPPNILKKINDLYMTNEDLCMSHEDQSHLNSDLDSNLNYDLDLISSQTTNFQKGYLSKFTHPKKIYSSKHLLSAEISEWSRGQLKIPMLMKFCGAKGEQFVRQCWAQAKDSNAKDQIALFMSFYGKQKVVMRESVEIKTN